MTRRSKISIQCSALDIWHSQTGFNLVEILLAIAILALLASFGFLSYSGYQRKVELDTTSRQLVETLRHAQGKAVSGEADKPWGVHFNADPINSYVLYRDDGSGYAGATQKETTNLSGYIKMSTVSIQGGGSDVLFQKRTGTTTTYGSGSGNEAVRLEDISSSGSYRKITITSQGRIDAE